MTVGPSDFTEEEMDDIEVIDPASFTPEEVTVDDNVAD